MCYISVNTYIIYTKKNIFYLVKYIMLVVIFYIYNYNYFIYILSIFVNLPPPRL